MDYVVFGIGFGATILVLGLVLRDFGPRLRYRRPAAGGDLLAGEELVGKVSWSRFCAALGAVLALTGAAFLVLTVVAMLLVVSDDTGLWIMSIAFGVLILIVLFWTWAYFDRFGSYGILPERTEAAKAPAQAPVRDAADEPQVIGPTLAETAADDWAEPQAELDSSLDDDMPEPRLETPEERPVEEWAESQAESDSSLDDAAPEPRLETPEERPVEEWAESQAGPDSNLGDAAPEPRLETPEERLAHAMDPIEHGSAEGDLDMGAAGPSRPPRRRTRQSTATTTPTTRADTPYHGPPIPANLKPED